MSFPKRAQTTPEAQSKTPRSQKEVADQTEAAQVQTTPETLKKELRDRYLKKRLEMSEGQWMQASDAIRERVLAFFKIQKAGIVHCFYPLINRREVDTRPIMTGLIEQGWTLCLPKTDLQSGTMTSIRVSDLDQLESKKFGLQEPMEGEEIAPDCLDAVILPCVAMDCFGGRIGYGGGFYDRYLQDVQAVTIAPCFELCLHPDRIPLEATDQMVDWIFTEKRGIQASK